MPLFPVWVAGAVLLAGCSPGGGDVAPTATSTAPPTAGSAGARTSSSAAGVPVPVATQVVDGLGNVLTTDGGAVLYLFEPDAQRRVTCTGVCAALWPPYRGTPTAAAGSDVQESLLGTVDSPDGGTQVTYNGWPLYTYVGDVGPGQANGHGLDANGGLWYAVAPVGAAAGNP